LDIESVHSPEFRPIIEKVFPIQDNLGFNEESKEATYRPNSARDVKVEQRQRAVFQLFNQNEDNEPHT
jgi:hypothetical protein